MTPMRTESKDKLLSLHVKQIRILDAQYCTKAPPIPDKKSLMKQTKRDPGIWCFLRLHPHLQPLNRTSTKALAAEEIGVGHQEILASSSHRPNNDLTLCLLGSSIFTRTPGLEVVPVLQQFKGASHGKELKTGNWYAGLC